MSTHHNVWRADENMKMTDCYYEKKDWRQCKDEVFLLAPPTSMTELQLTFDLFCFKMETFRRCWKAHGNNERTSSKDTERPVKS